MSEQEQRRNLSKTSGRNRKRKSGERRSGDAILGGGDPLPPNTAADVQLG